MQSGIRASTAASPLALGHASKLPGPAAWREAPTDGGASGECPRPAYFASSILRAVSVAAFFASAFSPTPISFTSTTTLRMVPVNFVLFGW